MSSEGTIRVFDALAPTLASDGRPIQARGVAEQLQRATDVSVEQLERNFSAFFANVERILSQAQTQVGVFQVERVEIEAVVSADGKVGLMGSSIGVAGKSTLKLVLERVEAK